MTCLSWQRSLPGRRSGAVNGRYQGPKAYEEAFAEIAARPPIIQEAVTEAPGCRISGQRSQRNGSPRGACSRETPCARESRGWSPLWSVRTGRSCGDPDGSAAVRSTAQDRSCSPQRGTTAQRRCVRRLAMPDRGKTMRSGRLGRSSASASRVHCLATD